MAILFHYKTILFSLFSLLCFAFTSSHIIPKFPSSLVSPELQQLTISSQNGSYRTKFFTQILDHFNYNPQSYQTFQQRYLINDTYWGGAKKKAPIFVYMGNEGDIEWFTQNTGFMFETAPYFNALLVFIEVNNSLFFINKYFKNRTELTGQIGRTKNHKGHSLVY